jgi:hypothetical protein
VLLAVLPETVTSFSVSRAVLLKMPPPKTIVAPGLVAELPDTVRLLSVVVALLKMPPPSVVDLPPVMVREPVPLAEVPLMPTSTPKPPVRSRSSMLPPPLMVMLSPLGLAMVTFLPKLVKGPLPAVRLMGPLRPAAKTMVSPPVPPLSVSLYNSTWRSVPLLAAVTELSAVVVTVRVAGQSRSSSSSRQGRIRRGGCAGRRPARKFHNFFMLHFKGLGWELGAKNRVRFADPPVNMDEIQKLRKIDKPGVAIRPGGLRVAGAPDGPESRRRVVPPRDDARTPDTIRSFLAGRFRRGRRAASPNLGRAVP